MPTNTPYTSSSNPVGATATPRANHVNPYDANNHGSRVDHALLSDSATSASAVAWAAVTGKPSEFAPSSHIHAASDIAVGQLADGRIAASNVTQHEAAIAMPLSQVSGGNELAKVRLLVAAGDGTFGELTTSPNATFIMNSGGDAVYTIKNKQTGFVDPTVTDDSLSGWSVWSRWINVNNGKEFVCVDNANGAAVWKETTAASGSGLASTEINTIAKLNAIVGDATLDTSSATRTPTAHNHAASEITSGTLPPARLGADSIDAITEIHTTLKTGADIKLVTGTNGTNGNLAAWNADGDLVDGGTTATPTAHTHAATDITETADAKVMTGVERTKLDGIEADATADQTAAQIKTAYEGEVNAFTDTQFTKLDGIEADATADQTAAQIETAYNSQVTIVSLVDAVAGTATVAGRWTPQRVAQAIAALAGDVRHVQTKEITIEDPIATEDVAMFYSHTAITISRLTIILVGSGSPSVTVDIRHHTDRSNAGTALITTPSATTSTTGGNKITVFNNPAVGAGSFVRCKTTAQGGTVTEMMVTIEYIED